MAPKKMPAILNILARGVLLLALTGMVAPAFAARVVGITDGDTLTILDHRERIRIRLANIDAPERYQPYNERARQSLAELCYGKDAIYLPEAVDKYGRTIAIVVCEGVEANRTQVARGWAWVYTRNTAQSHALKPLEQAARERRLGLWHGRNPVPPWEWRKQRAEGSDDKPSRHYVPHRR